MIKTRNIYLILLFLLTFTFTVNTSYSRNSKYNWYSNQSSTVKNNWEKLKKKEKEKYVNKILKYLKTINGNNLTNYDIYYEKNKNFKNEYIFINKKLCIMVKIYYNQSITKTNSIIQDFVKNYGKPSLSKNGIFTNYTFHSKSDNIQLITRPFTDKYDIKIYYYPVDLFKVLLHSETNNTSK